VRRGIVTILTALCLISLAGCGKEQGGKNPEQGVVQQETTKKPETSKKTGGKINAEVRLKAEVEFTPEDYNIVNAMLNETETGYYYYSEIEDGLRYIDKKTGIDMYLCNKPECRHDGNAFCVATNDAYAIESFCIYNGKLLANVIEETDTQYLYKVMMIALDGSKMEELVTYQTLQKTQQRSAAYFKGGTLLIHRNKMVIPMRIVGQGELEDSVYYGTFILDMDTWEITGLGEELLSKENEEIVDFTVHGDYLYYCRKEAKKTVLCRYHLTEGTEERYKLLTGFDGQYAVPDDSTVVYSTKSSLCVHHHDTGINEEKVALMATRKREVSEGYEIDQTLAYQVVCLETDGEYIYAFEGVASVTIPGDGNEPAKKIGERYVHVFDREFHEVLDLNCYEAIQTTTRKAVPDVSYSIPGFFINGDELYMTSSAGDFVHPDLVLRGKRSDFLAGNPKFEVVMKKQY